MHAIVIVIGVDSALATSTCAGSGAMYLPRFLRARNAVLSETLTAVVPYNRHRHETATMSTTGAPDKTNAVVRVNKRNHGYETATAVSSEAEADAVVKRCKKRRADKVLVADNMVYAEYANQVNYQRGLKSASKHLGRTVVRLNVPFHEVVRAASNGAKVHAMIGYTEDELCSSYDPAKQRRNRNELAVLKNSTARELVETGVVAPSKFALVVKTQTDLGILLQDDGARRRKPAGFAFKLTFVVNGTVLTHEIVVPRALPNPSDMLTDEIVGNCTQQRECAAGGEVIDIVLLPTVRARIDNADKRCHYWFWSRTPSTGKSTNMNGVADIAFAMITRYHSGFFDHVDPQAQIVFIDEYGNGAAGEMSSRRLPLSDLNLMCDGGYRFNQKNKNPVELADRRPLIVIFSNKPPEEVYTLWGTGTQRFVPNEDDLSLLRVRFNIVRIDQNTDDNLFRPDNRCP